VSLGIRNSRFQVPLKGSFLEGPESCPQSESQSEVRNLLTTELFYSLILTTPVPVSGATLTIRHLGSVVSFLFSLVSRD